MYLELPTASAQAVENAVFNRGFNRGCGWDFSTAVAIELETSKPQFNRGFGFAKTFSKNLRK